MTSSEVIKTLQFKWPNAILSHEECCAQDSVAVRLENVKDILAFLKHEPQSFAVLMDLTAVDYLEPQPHTNIIYWLQNPDSYARLRILTSVPRDKPISTVCDLWAGANWYEREIYDLFGVNFSGHPSLKRILMPDDWNGHPLRRDYSLTEEPVQFKHGVKPKVPSEIIPHVTNTRPV